MKDVIFFFTEADGRVRQVLNGVVTSMNKKTPLRHAPIGSHDISILWERSTKYWATVRNFSLPLGFVRDAAKILRNDYYKFNIDRQLFLLVKLFQSTIDDLYFYDYYKHLYKGELDFSTFDDQQGDSKVQISIMEGGLSKLVKANENTQFFIPFDEDAILVNMDGVALEGVYNWIMPEDQSLGFFFAGMYQTPSEKAAPGIAVFDVTQQPGHAVPDDLANSINYFASSTQSISNVTIKGTFKYIQEGPDGGPLNDPSVPFFAELQIYNTETESLRLQIDIAPDDPYQSTQDIPFTTTIDLVKGDRLFLKKGSRFRESSLQMTLKSRPNPKSVKHFKPLDLFKKLCAKLGISADKVTSTLLANCTYCVTSGDGLRGLADAGIKTSFSDFCKAFNVYLFAGVQIKNTIEFEGRDNYFVPDSTDPAIELGICSDFNPKPANDLMFSSIKIGHREQDIQDLNGKFDFNGYHIYTTPIKRNTQQMDLQSPYKSGPYEETITQQNLEGKTTTDNSNDNDVFVNDIALVPASYIKSVTFVAAGNYFIIETGVPLAIGQTITITNSANNDGQYTITNLGVSLVQFVYVTGGTFTDELNANVILEILTGLVYELDRSVVPDTGVPDPDTIFNVRLRPSALFEKHYRWIRSWLYGYDADEVVFENANRNSGLVVNGLTDGRNVKIKDMGNRIFIPDYMEFLTKVPVDLGSIMDSTPNKCFAFTWNDHRYTGFLFKSGLAPCSRKPQTFTLLSSIENDRESLIQ